MNSEGQTIKQSMNKGGKFSLSKYTSVFILVILVALLSILNENFLKILTFKNLMQQISPVGIVSIGAMLVIITGGIDFTAGYGLAVAGVTAGVFYQMFGNSLLALLLAGILAGGIIGLINGLIIAKLKISPFIATLAMMSVCQGMALLIYEGRIILIDNESVLFIGQGYIMNIVSFSFILFIAVALIGALLLYKTRFGVYLYALGGNEDSVRLAGINVDRVKIMVYTFTGLCYGLASVITIATVANITNNLQGSMLLDAIASTVIGGTSISGGKGTVFGTFVGVIIIGLIATALTYLNVDTLLRDAVKGIIIIVALLLDVVINKKVRIED